MNEDFDSIKTLYRSTFCTDPTSVPIQLLFRDSGAEVVPDSTTVYTVLVQEVYRYGTRVVTLFSRYKKCSYRRSKKCHGAV